MAENATRQERARDQARGGGAGGEAARLSGVSASDGARRARERRRVEATTAGSTPATLAWPISACASPAQLQRMRVTGAARRPASAWRGLAAPRCIGQVAAVQAAVQVWAGRRAAVAPCWWPWSQTHAGPRRREGQRR